MEGPEAAPSCASRLRWYAQLLRESPRRHQAFAALVVLQLLMLLVERAYLFSASLATTTRLGEDRENLWFMLIIVVSAGFVCYFALHSMVETNGYELLMYAVSSLLLVARIGVEFGNRADECGEGRETVCGAFLALALACMTAALVLSWGMREDLQWKRYKALGAQVATNAIYRTYELFTALRALDVQFSLLMLITGFVFVAGETAAGPRAGAATGVLVALVLVEGAWDALAARGVDREDFKALAAFWALSLATPLAMLLALVESLTERRLFTAAPSETVRWTIFAMGACAALTRLATVGVSLLLYRNFGPNYVALRRIIEGGRRAAFGSGRGRAAKPGRGGGGGAERAENPLAAVAVAAAAAEVAAGGGADGGSGPANAVREWASK